MQRIKIIDSGLDEKIKTATKEEMKTLATKTELKAGEDKVVKL